MSTAPANLDLDFFGSQGGSNLTVGGTLTNTSSGTVQVGTSGGSLNATSTVSAATLSDITFDTSVLGSFTEMLSFDVESINPNFDGFLGLVTLTLEGDVVSSGPSVAEPGTMTVLASGLGMVFFAVRRRRRMP